MMNVSNVGSGFSASSASTAPQKRTSASFLRQLAAKLPLSVRVREGNRLSTLDIQSPKTVVVMNSEFTQKANAVSELEDALEANIEKLHGTRTAFSALEKAGFDLTVKGFTIDKKGNIFCHGRDNKAEADFEINLGKASDRNNYTQMIYSHFEVSGSQLLFSGINKLV